MNLHPAKMIPMLCRATTQEQQKALRQPATTSAAIHGDSSCSFLIASGRMRGSKTFQNVKLCNDCVNLKDSNDMFTFVKRLEDAACCISTKGTSAGE